MDNRDSRARLRALEQDESYRERLIDVIGRLERTIEEAAINYLEDPGNASERSTTLVNMVPAESDDTTQPESSSNDKASDVSDILAPVQIRMAQSLSKLSNLKKELVFIDPVFNSHAVIIARDVKRFKHHEQGHGVLRHAADHFIM